MQVVCKRPCDPTTLTFPPLRNFGHFLTALRQNGLILFLTSDIFSRNLLIPLTPGIKKALQRSFRSDVWIQSQTVVCFSFWSGRFCASVPVASEREPRSRSGQRMSECVLHRWSRGLAWHSVRLCPCGEESRAAQRSIPFGCGPDSSGGRASSNACAGAAGSRTPYNPDNS